MPTKEGKYRIVSGPDSDICLIDSLAMRGSGLQFCLKLVSDDHDDLIPDDKRVVMKLITVTSLGYEDDSADEVWVFKGYVNKGGYIIEGFYSHKSCTGEAFIRLRTVTCKCGEVWPWGRFRKDIPDCPKCNPDKWNAVIDPA